MSNVLLISKPVAPPWNDSSKNLVRDLALGLQKHAPTVLTSEGAPALGSVRAEPIYGRGRGAFAPALTENARVARRLLAGDPHDLWHFFFAPNARTSRVARALARVRRRPTVQTVCSVPRSFTGAKELFFADRVVVLSHHTRARVTAAGIAETRVVHIPPAAPPLPAPTLDDARAARTRLGLPLDAPILLYPGDLEFGRGATIAADAHAALGGDAVLVFATRPKTAGASDAARSLRDHVTRLRTGARVRWWGDTPQILDLVVAADIVCLVSDEPYAKMDYPLVVLEAMMLARPALVAVGTPAAELADLRGALAIEPTVDALTATFRSLLDDTDVRRALGAQARRAATTSLDREAMARRYESVYDAVL